MFISVGKIIESLIISVLFAALLCGCCYRLLGILQSCGYGNARLLKWAKKKNNMALTRHILLAMLCALACAVISLCFSFAGEWSAVVGLSAYVIMFSVYIWADNRVALRTPAVATARFKRLYAVLAIITLVAVYFAVTLLNYAAFAYAKNYGGYWGAHIFGILRYCPLAVFPLLLIPLVLLANLISKIYEVPHNKSFVKKATRKLQTSSIKVVGITGSYGKTSTKHILSQILGAKYRVLSTPRSHNTPMGLALSLNNNKLSDYDIFIAEMGARNVGDIAELSARLLGYNGHMPPASRKLRLGGKYRKGQGRNSRLHQKRGGYSGRLRRPFQRLSVRIFRLRTDTKPRMLARGLCVRR